MSAALPGFIRQAAVICALAFTIVHAPRQSQAEPLIGEIRWVAFGYAPVGWMKCDGTLLSITQNPALFSLLGTYYGGNGTTTFALPDMRGRSPVAADYSLHTLGSPAGQEHVPLVIQNLPQHTHTVLASNSAGNSGSPTNGVWAQTPVGNQLYKSSGTPTAMAAGSVGSVGSGLAIQVMQPYAVLNCIIATTGYFPTRP